MEHIPPGYSPRSQKEKKKKPQRVDIQHFCYIQQIFFKTLALMVLMGSNVPLSLQSPFICKKKKEIVEPLRKLNVRNEGELMQRIQQL